MRFPVIVSLLVVGGCAEERSAPVKYPDACGSHVECFTQGLLKLDQAEKRLQEAQRIALTSVPIGTVIAFTGTNDPPGWMFCDGRTLDKNDPRFRALFDAIGTTHGGDANPTFQIPDYRGMFLRGMDAGAGRDPDAARRTAPGVNGSGNSGDAVGTAQQDALQTHQHDVSYTFRATGSNGTRDADDGNKKFNSDPPSAAFSISIGNPTNARAALETRPRNISVRWLIRVQ